MKKTLAVLVATAALTAAIGLPAWSTMCTQAGAEDGHFGALFDDGQKAFRLILVSDDDTDQDEHSRRPDDDDDDCDDDDDANVARTGARNSAPEDSLAPPQNGLFGTGSPPKVQLN